ncbi:IclR family transcriptional regulator [Chakrabartyella piscis]|uniref:IclR family transcriptional regulator n=1 Tax=Chakrabartyella piscis TaxID=2918914 RepID=UPI002958B107|nr:IclR family transcriptional regulator [Chakrabartyella piscis]
MLINSVDRALDVLILLHEEGRDMGVSEIAEKLDIYKSTVFRTLFTLEQKGFVKQNPNTERYGLGLKLFSIGMGMKDKISLKKIIRPYAKALQEEFSEVVNVSVLDLSHPKNPLSMIIEKEIGLGQMLIVNPPVGATSSCYGSSVGKCLLAYSDLDLNEFRGSELIQYTENSIVDWDLLIENIKQVKEDGYAVDNEELEIGLTCIGAPILNADKIAVAAISLSGPTQRMRDGDFSHKVQRVREVAAEASKEFC